MNDDREGMDELDAYVKGGLDAAAVAAIEARMENDAVFRERVARHQALVSALKRYGYRNGLRAKLEQIHTSMDTAGKVVSMPAPAWGKYWPTAAVAASVALISVVSALWIQHALNAQAPDAYVAMRQDLAVIRKSQQKMARDIADVREKKFKPANYSGTGFLISANGYVATSYHLVKDADSIYLENEKFGSLRAVMVYSDPQTDVSILQIASGWKTRPLPYTVVKREAALGEKVYTLGFPREDIVFGEGSVSALSGHRQNADAYQISIPVNPGNSGGPLLNERGDLIGIISGVQPQMQGAAFAVKSQALLAATQAPELDTLARPIILPKRNSLQTANRVQQIERLRDFVFVVKVY